MDTPIFDQVLTHIEPFMKKDLYKHSYLKKYNLIKNTDVLIIDEISMLSADLFEKVDEVLTFDFPNCKKKKVTKNERHKDIRKI